MRTWVEEKVVRGIGCLSLAMLAAVGCGTGATPQATSEAPGSTEAALEQESWEVVFLSGERVGHTHTQVYRESRPSGNVLRIEHEELLTLLSYGNLIHAKSNFTSIETPDGHLLEFSSVLPQGAAPMETTGRVVGDELHLEVGTGGETIKATLPWAAEMGGPYRMTGSLRDKPLTAGESRTLHYLDIAANRPATTILTAADYEDTDLRVGSRRLLRVAMQTSIGEHEIHGTIWMGEDGEIEKTQVAEMLDYVAIRATREEATQEVKKIDFDLGKRLAVAVERTLPKPHETKRVVYRIELERANPARVFDSGPTQQVTAEDEHTILATVYAVRPGEKTGNPEAEAEGTSEVDLEPNALIQSDDEKVISLAQVAAGDIQDPWQVAVALEKFVSLRMTSVGISSAFATAAEVARTLTGDCTEHAVLLAALARARGIPARVAIGLVYFRGAFLYHMWTEVYVDEAWIPLDATLGQGGIGAAHLKITDTSLQGASPQAAFLPVTEVIGQLKIEIVEVE